MCSRLSTRHEAKASHGIFIRIQMVFQARILRAIAIGDAGKLRPKNAASDRPCRRKAEKLTIYRFIPE